MLPVLEPAILSFGTPVVLVSALNPPSVARALEVRAVRVHVDETILLAGHPRNVRQR